MSTTSTLKTTFLIAATLASGCFKPQTNTDSSGDGYSEDGGQSAGSGGASGETTSIYDIQMNTIGEGTIVTVQDAVVTTQITEGEYPAFFIQSAEGGEYNGIYVFKYDEVEYTPVVGDIVTVTGEYTEFYGLSQIKVTEPGNIQKTDTGGTVVVTEIDEEPDNWEAYESVVVQLNDATISDASKLYEWGSVELDIGCWMDNDFTNYDAEDGASYTSITGPITYSFEKFAILPRSTDDLQGYTGSTGGGASGGGPSGGGSGGGTPIDATVEDVQRGDVAEGALVNLTGVISTSGLNKYDKGFYVQDEAGGPWSGVYIYVYDEVAETLTDLEDGEVLDLTGEVTEYYDLTEIVVTQVGDITRTGEIGAVMIDSVGDTPDDWEAWEGCLVITDAVTVAGEPDEHGAAPLDNGLYLDDDFFDFDIAEGSTFSSVTGIVSYAFDEFRLLPRNADGMTE